jgi:hypothetical protein
MKLQASKLSSFAKPTEDGQASKLQAPEKLQTSRSKHWVGARVSESEQQNHEYGDSQQGEETSQNGGARPRNPEAQFSHGLHVQMMLDGSYQKAEIAEPGQNKGKATRTDDVLAGFEAGYERHELEKFIRAEAERDERGGGPNPGHHGALVGKAGALKSQFVRDGELRFGGWIFCTVGHR